MKPLDSINTPFTWNAGAVVLVLSVVGTVLSNPAALAAVGTIVSSSPWSVKLAALGALAGIIAIAVGKPPATSSAQKGPSA